MANKANTKISRLIKIWFYFYIFISTINLFKISPFWYKIKNKCLKIINIESPMINKTYYENRTKTIQNFIATLRVLIE